MLLEELKSNFPFWMDSSWIVWGLVYSSLYIQHFIDLSGPVTNLKLPGTEKSKCSSSGSNVCVLQIMRSLGVGT